ncbi:hypothetical protein HHI36_021700 [Cryptolaemus montrouzieri]|uniref:C2H2-type domain-containing protein n=1 Tax=Cryptolaemus montrouzieri TaxID=559131 RepID=A0ABD2MYX4_9CUCU
MPPKKSNLNNARSREARRKRVERAHQLVDRKNSELVDNIWNFRASKQKFCGEKSLYNIDFVKIEPEQPEEFFSKESETSTNEFVVGEKKIRNQEDFIKHESGEDLDIDNENEAVVPKIKTELIVQDDGNRSVIPEIKVELAEYDSKSLVQEFITENGNNWHEEPMYECCEDLKVENDENEAVTYKIKEEVCEEDSKPVVDELLDDDDDKIWYEESILEDSVKRKEIEEDFYSTLIETSGADSSTHSVLKKHKCDRCDYSSPRRDKLIAHVNSVHLNIRNHKCSQCDYQASQKYYLTKHIRSIHLGIKDHKCCYCDYQTNEKVILKII